MFQLLLRTKRSLTARGRLRLDRWDKSPLYRRAQGTFHIGLALVVIILAILLFPRHELLTPPDSPREGDIATRDIIAPFDFYVPKTATELDEESRRIEQETPPVLAYDQHIADSVQRTVADFFDRAERLAASPISPRLRLERLKGEFPWMDLDDLPAPRPNAGWLALRYAVIEIVQRLYASGVFPDNRFLPVSRSTFVMVHRPGVGDLPLQRDQINDAEGTRQRLDIELAEIPGVETRERDAVIGVVANLLAANLTYDHETTTQRRQTYLTAITAYKVHIFRGERIVAQNERVTAAHVERLAALAQTRVEELSRRSFITQIVPISTRFFFAGFCVAGLGAYFWFFQPRLLRRTAVILLSAVLWTLVLIAARIAHGAGGPYLYLIPIPLAAILTTVLIDLGTGLVSTIFLSLLVGLVTGFDYTILFVNIAAGLVSAASARMIRRRYDFYRPALYGGFAAMAAIILTESLRYTEFEGIVRAAGYGLVNAVLGSIIAVGILPIFESLFGFTTDLTLLELSNMNHPLLRRLSLEAPGTYHHSIVLGNLTEAASEAVGANALLARVGAYFHDIGKMEKPEYFVENFHHLRSKHDRLTPTMSALILESHVKRGKELALEYNLPDSVIDFIEQHHGTTTMSFFFRKAQEQNPDESVPEEEFRYPGPKPQTRETAILMLADSTEALTRTLDDPKPGRLHAAIKKVVEDKFRAGQLEECDLTLRDLHKIEQSFLKVLLGVFHQRIDYPSPVVVEDTDDRSGGNSASALLDDTRHAPPARRLPRPSA